MEKLTRNKLGNKPEYISGKPTLVVRCPSCRKSVAWNHAPFKPFCSERCKLIDLGAWVHESNRIPGEEAVISEDEFHTIC